MNDWDLMGPLAGLDGLLADADSGSYDLEDILAEFGTAQNPPRKAGKPDNIQEKTLPDGSKGGEAAEKDRREAESVPAHRPPAGGSAVSSTSLQREKTGGEERSLMADFASLWSRGFANISLAGKYLNRPILSRPEPIAQEKAVLERDLRLETGSGLAPEGSSQTQDGEADGIPAEKASLQKDRMEEIRREEARLEKIRLEKIQAEQDRKQEVRRDDAKAEAPASKEEEKSGGVLTAGEAEAPGGADRREAPADQEAFDPGSAEETAAAAPHKIGLFASLRKALEQADEYAQNMYPEETNVQEEDEEEETPEAFDVRAWEEGKKKLSRKRRPLRPDPLPEPERSPEEMAKRYAKGLSALKCRIYIVVFLCLALCYIVFCEKYQLPLPGGAQNRFSSCVLISVVLECAAIVLGLHVLIDGVRSLIHLQAGLNTLVAFSVLASLVDGICLMTLHYRPQSLPFCAVSAASILFSMWGGYMKRKGTWMTFRAACAPNPYVVTRDKKKWNTQGCIIKHPGKIDGFVIQVEQPDGAERIFERIAPLLLIASLIFAVLASVGRQRPALFFWSFSAIIAASASFSSFFAYALPFSVLARRLMHSGAALGGWKGISSMVGKNGITLTDTDLFPPGSILLNGIKVFGDFQVDKVISCAASMMREAECGLEKIFHELLRSQGAIYRRVEEFCFYEEGGYGANIRGDQVLVGSADFMRRMEVALPQGLKVKNAVFCAIDGELAGIFAVNYSPSPAVRGFMGALLKSKLAPVLATRDFNLSPAMLAQKFKLRTDRLQFPPMEQRLMLSRSHGRHSKTVAALISREGLPPLVETVAGGRRLRRAAMSGTAISVAGSLVGMLMACYLTSAEAFASISAANLLFFMLLWLVPILLLAGRINRS
ncbi:MAG: hypothetical protein PHT34_01475 [Oscillospiraceae bacterium]|nr:hypothetical protein [Oscillospiraceae bacterium]